ncbi:MAG TPA: hypothetical protein VE981_03870 [Planctomycetota bacterium]|nr:hypothetical protein [Planctomycetota bacterium]
MVKAVRVSLVVVILLNLALLAVSGPLRTTLMRYDLARKQADLRKLVNENRSLLGGVAQSRRPDRVTARALAMGLDLHLLESEAMAGSTPAADTRRLSPLPVVPRH